MDDQPLSLASGLVEMGIGFTQYWVLGLDIIFTPKTMQSYVQDYV